MIGDVEFKVETNIKRASGEFFYWEKDDKTGEIKPGKIIIGTKTLKANPTKVFSIIMHELKEIIQEEQSVRFQRADEDGCYEFHYNHSQHTDLCARLAGLLKEFL